MRARLDFPVGKVPIAPYILQHALAVSPACCRKTDQVIDYQYNSICSGQGDLKISPVIPTFTPSVCHKMGAFFDNLKC